MKRFFCLWILSCFVYPKLWACASCSSGGDDPLVLYPNEKSKVYIGLSHTSAFSNISTSGQRSQSLGPEAKQTYVTALGLGLSPRTFITSVFPLARNIRQDDSSTGMADPLMSIRHSVIMQSFADPWWIPQIQVIFAYKYAFANSVHTSQDNKSQMDVFGSGFPEFKAGLDLWYGLYDAKAGAAYQFIMKKEQVYAHTLYQPGNTHKFTLTSAFSWNSSWQTLAGLVRDLQLPSMIDSVLYQESHTLNHGAFVTQDYKLSQTERLKLTMSAQGIAFSNYNTARSHTVGLGYMRSF